MFYYPLLFYRTSILAVVAFNWLLLADVSVTRSVYYTNYKECVNDNNNGFEATLADCSMLSSAS